uniref:ERF017 n=1 Tax=Fragaria nilgerrensis TaxID=64941 RepID=A0A7U3S0H7_9ROSA|nr:ERF017 [Fragaria nilgerrensis]
MVMKQSIIGNPSEQNNDAKYKGVRKRKWGKWVSEIRLPNSRERIWLGSYDTPEKAARAFDAALYCLRGGTAKFNFPDNPPEISGGRSLSPAEIQAEAARFANNNDANPPIPPPQVPRSHSDLSMSEQRTEESPSVSEGSGTLVMDSASDFSVTVNQNEESFSDLFRTFGSGNYASEYGLFPGFDDLNGQFFSPAPQTPADDYAEESLAQESFLWNF